MAIKNNCCFVIFSMLMHILVSGYSQSVNKVDSICWCRDYKLKWSDFTGTVPEGSDWQAISGISISINGYRKGGLPTYEIMNLFVKQSSWTKNTSESLLEHERLHFDIGEIYARKMRYAVDSLRRKGEAKMSTYRSVIDSLYDRWEKWGDAYDQETGNGLRTSKQSEWSIKIRNELYALEKYATKCSKKYTP